MHDDKVTQHINHTPANRLTRTYSLSVQHTSLILNMHVMVNWHLSKQGCLFLIPLNHVLFISLHVRAVELVILVKPIGILTCVLMSISFGTKIPTFLNTSVFLKGVRISVIFLVLRLSIMPAHILNLK